MLGREATSTHGNARETAAWVADKNIKSLSVVTVAWHMPRALVELRYALPGVTLHPVPVAPVDRGPTATAKLYADEYMKYLAAVAGLPSVLPSRNAPPRGGAHG